MTEHTPQHSSDRKAHGRHELPREHARPEIGALNAGGVAGVARKGRSQVVFGVLGVVLCLLLGVAIATQVRQTDSGDALETARPADLLILLDSLQQREAALNSEVAELQQTLAQLQASGNNDEAAIENARSRLAALSILIGSVPATGPGVTLTITDPTQGVAAETMLDVINELRAAGTEAMEIRGERNGEQVAVRVGVDTWVVGAPGALIVDSNTMGPTYSILAIGDAPTLAAAMNIPGGAVDSVERVGGTMTVQQSERVDVTALRQPKARQYAQPVK
ncbi:DUF881 domain-containing protein [Mycobacterium sp. SMC-4]|uniref:DUF881 domain-containing protein n=1 Tax=Mycobacterium sp. SMC-4 TaxID=2857059 RepID=UPI0021B470F0|nr:DUF881 domain-containing protein [Mycobacterium sp. SMC-4]UXA15905.1 DUF881 domain-containing protein [Mycobacterium sp. SMC-4]